MNDIECSSLLDEDLDAAEQKTGSALITIFIMEIQSCAIITSPIITSFLAKTRKIFEN